MNAASHIKAVSAGTKITIVTHNIFGQPVETPVTTMGEVRQHGYYTEGGGWGLYPCNLPGQQNIECWEVLLRERRKRNAYWVKIGYTLKGYKLGW